MLFSTSGQTTQAALVRRSLWREGLHASLSTGTGKLSSQKIALVSFYLDPVFFSFKVLRDTLSKFLVFCCLHISAEREEMSPHVF